MFNPKLSTIRHKVEDEFTRYVVGDKEFNNFHKLMINNFITKYYTSNNYNDSNHINTICDNINNILTKLKFENINKDSSVPMYKYVIDVSGKLTTLELMFYSFFSTTSIKLGFIYGVNDQVLIEVNKSLIRNLYSDIELEHSRLLSLKGEYEALLNPDYCNKPLTFNSVYMHLLGNSLKDNNLKMDYPEIYDLINKKMAAIKFYFAEENLHKDYLDENGNIKYDDVIYNLNLNDMNYDDEMLNELEYNINPLLLNLLKFQIMSNRMIDIKDLDEIISEIVIDNYLIDAINLKSHINEYISNSTIHDDVLVKINSMISNYYNYICAVIISITKLNDTFFNPNQIDALYDSLGFKYNLTKDNIYDKIESVLNNENPAQINNMSKDNIKKLMPELADDDIEAFFKNINKKFIIYSLITRHLIDNVDNFVNLYRVDRFIKIFDGVEMNLNSYSIFKTLFPEVETIIGSINYNQTELTAAINEIDKKMRAKYNIENSIDNLFTIFDNYIAPVYSNLESINETIDIVNNAFSSMQIPND